MIRYKMVGLMYTRACPLACDHCITESSPRAKGRMRLRDAEEYLKAIPHFSSAVSFTGGEPFLYHKEIVELTSEAKSHGLGVVVVTGAGWVREEAAARSKIHSLAKAGLQRLLISWDNYHEAHSLRERAVMLARLAIEEGVEVSVRSVVCAHNGPDEHRKAFANLPVDFESLPLIQLGRAASLPSSHFVRDKDPPKGVCGVVLRPVIDPDGVVYACCGPSLYSTANSPLVLGNARDEPLERILARGTLSPLLEVIRNLGPYGLYRLLQDHPIGRERFKARVSYTGICELCLDITNDPELVLAAQQHLMGRDARALLAASSLWWKKKIEPQLLSQPAR